MTVDTYTDGGGDKYHIIRVTTYEVVAFVVVVLAVCAMVVWLGAQPA